MKRTIANALFLTCLSAVILVPSASAALINIPAPTCNSLRTACVGARVGWCSEGGYDCLSMHGGHEFSALAIMGVGDLSSFFHDTRFNNVCVVNGADHCDTHINHDLGTGVPECGQAQATSTPMVAESVTVWADNFDDCSALALELLFGGGDDGNAEEEAAEQTTEESHAGDPDEP